MAQHNMSTYVAVEQAEDDGDTKAIWSAAAERLQGTDGIKCAHMHYADGKLCGTFTRSWETPDPEPESVTHTLPEGVEKE